MQFLHVLINVYYISNGIIPYENYKKYEIFLFVAVMVNNSILCFGLIAALWKSTSMVYNAQITAATCGIIYQFSFKLLAHFNQKHIAVTTSKLCEDSKFNVTDILAKVQNKVIAKFLPFLLAGFVVTIIGFNTTFLHFLIKPKIDFNDPNFHVIPYLFQFSQINTLDEYLVLFFLQMTVFLPEVVAYFSTIVYMCYVLASVEVYAEEIGNCARSLTFFDKTRLFKQRILSNGTENFKELKMMENELKNLVKFQQYFYRYLDDVLHVGEIIFNIMFSLVIFSFVFLIFSIKASKDELSKLKILAVVVAFMVVYYLLCYLGEAIRRMNEVMLAAFYEIPWYHYTPHLRKYVIMLMTQAHREFSLKPMNLCTVDLDFYGQTMKVVYSISNLMFLKRDV